MKKTLISTVLIATLALVLLNCGKKKADPAPSTPTTPTNPVTATAPTLDNAANATTSSDITAASAKVSSILSANGGVAISQHGHVWSETNVAPTTADSKTELGKTDGPFPLKFTSEVKSLKANTTYNVRAYATNDKGTSYGSSMQVKTGAEAGKVNGTVLLGISSIDAVPTDDKFYALDLETGSVKWVFKSGRGVNAVVAVADGIAYVTSGKNLYAIDITTGIEKWKYSTSENFDTPLVSGGVVYVSEGQSYTKLLAIDASKGTKKWELSLNSLNATSSCPTVANGLLYITSGSKLFAVDAVSGVLKWSYTTGGTASPSNPAVSNNIVYVCSNDGNAYAFDAATGSRKWFAKLGDWGGSPTIANGIVYAYSYNGYLLAFDALTGTKKWEYQTKIKGYGDPFVGDGLVYVANVAVDAITGAKKLDFTNGRLRPIVVNGVFYTTKDRQLTAINAANGTQKWLSPQLTGYPLTPVIIGNDGKVYYSSDSGAQQ